MIFELFKTAIENFIDILPVVIIAIIVSQIISVYLPRKKIKAIFVENEKNIVEASAVGVATPGPILAYLPLLRDLNKKGMPLSIIAAFITGQTLIGPARFFIEADYFSVRFFVVRAIISLLIAICIGTCFRFISNYSDR